MRQKEKYTIGFSTKFGTGQHQMWLIAPLLKPNNNATKNSFFTMLSVFQQLVINLIFSKHTKNWFLVKGQLIYYKLAAGRLPLTNIKVFISFLWIFKPLVASWFDDVISSIFWFPYFSVWPISCTKYFKYHFVLSIEIVC